jgi:hypothetical protein
MKDQYVGDVNDYAKYQLLRLCQRTFERVIVAWMLTAPDNRGDGARTGYLRDMTQRALDPELFDELASIVDRDERKVAAVEASEALRGCTFIHQQMPIEERGRREYFAALESLAGPGSLVFFDPDNGFEVGSVTRHKPGSERYLYFEELGSARGREASVVIYQHFPRVERTTYVLEKLQRLGGEMGPGYKTFSAHSSQVAFLFAVTETRATEIEEAVRSRCEENEMLKFVAGA